MLVENQKVKVIWNTKNRKHFVNRGYNFTEYGAEFEVEIEDLTEGSTWLVQVKCDYCQKPFKKEYFKFLNQRKNSISGKDCCEKCATVKRKEESQLKYGVDHYIQRKNIIPSRRLDFKLVQKGFENLGLQLLSNKKDYKNNVSKLEFICSKHKEVGLQITTWADIKRGRLGCKFCAIEEYEDVMFWDNGRVYLRAFLRDSINKWKLDSMKNCNYKCVITGEPFDVIHHLYGFNNIFHKLFEISGLPLHEEIAYYSEQELTYLKDLCIELHYKYGFGVCLKQNIHYLFHSYYGKHNNTPEQFEEFIQRYYNGEFKEVI